MLNISEIVAKAEAMFDLFNAHFYAGEMARPAITVSPDGGRGAYGWCSVYEIWQSNGAALLRAHWTWQNLIPSRLKIRSTIPWIGFGSIQMGR